MDLKPHSRTAVTATWEEVWAIRQTGDQNAENGARLLSVEQLYSVMEHRPLIHPLYPNKSTALIVFFNMQIIIYRTIFFLIFFSIFVH